MQSLCFFNSKLWASTFTTKFSTLKIMKTVKHYHISFAHILCIIDEERVAPLIFEIMKRIFFISLFFWFQIQHSEYAQFHVYSIVSNIITHLKKKEKKIAIEKKKSVPDFYKWTMLQKRNKNLKILLLGCKKLNPRRRNRYMKGFQSF